jgi:hypothetical protein
MFFGKKESGRKLLFSKIPHHSRLLRVFKHFLIVITDQDRKKITTIIYEFIVSSYRTRCLATHYFTNFLHKKGVDNCFDYLSHKEWRKLQDTVSSKECGELLGNKFLFQQYFSKTNIPLPQMVGYNIRETLLIPKEGQWEKVLINTPELLSFAFDRIYTISHTHSIFIKPNSDFGGRGVIKISKETNIHTSNFLNKLVEELTAGSFIFQSEIIQHEELSKIYPYSANSIRIDTFKTQKDNAEILSAYLRMGMNRKFVDNITAGGLYVGINLENGELKKTAIRKLYNSDDLFLAHPDTNVKFEGYVIPYFNEVKELAVAAANWLPQSIVGWDFAISLDGPILIEGNTQYYNMSCSDIAFGGYRRNSVYQKAVDYMNQI